MAAWCAPTVSRWPYACAAAVRATRGAIPATAAGRPGRSADRARSRRAPPRSPPPRRPGIQPSPPPLPGGAPRAPCAGVLQVKRDQRRSELVVGGALRAYALWSDRHRIPYGPPHDRRPGSGQTPGAGGIVETAGPRGRGDRSPGGDPPEAIRSLVGAVTASAAAALAHHSTA